MSVQQPFLRLLRYIHVTQFGSAVLIQKYVGTLQIPVEDLDLVEGPEPSDDGDEYAPDLFFLDVGLLVLVVGYFLKQIPVVGVLQHNTKRTTLLVYKSLVVGTNSGVIHTCQYSDFVQGIFLLLV